MFHRNKICYTIIPDDASLPLQTLDFTPNDNDNNDDSGSILQNSGDALLIHLSSSSSSSSSELCSLVSDDIIVTPLLRIRYSPPLPHPGIYAYHNNNNTSSQKKYPNIRATTLAMAMGLPRLRFFGTVAIGRIAATTGSGSRRRHLNFRHEEINKMCSSPDVRGVLKEDSSGDDDDDCWWLMEASRENYRDGGSLLALKSVMMDRGTTDTDDEDDNDDESAGTNEEDDDDDETSSENSNQDDDDNKKQSLTNVTLCLYCRGPCSSLCDDCEGAYFCQLPRSCRINGWSHQCLCSTWKRYVERRSELSQFPFVASWHEPLMERSCQLSEEPYEMFLKRWNIWNKAWWMTESGGGWMRRKNDVRDCMRRRMGYREGFGGLDSSLLPPEKRFIADNVNYDERDIVILNDWKDYYTARNIPLSSPVALLLTFPLTIYHAIRKYGAVPLTVSQMLKRPLRVHVVGVEKEINFLDLFKEVGFLMPLTVEIELTFIIRTDMLPPNTPTPYQINLLPNLSLTILTGTYNSPTSLDPRFDIPNGPPDMIIGLNAGLYAYPSWRDVLRYLDDNEEKGVVGVFTDYNEHSGVNCAGLGGRRARESLEVNPFRQPRAMPVYCMNLPQFSNGFMYVYNWRELE